MKKAKVAHDGLPISNMGGGGQEAGCWTVHNIS